MKWQRFFRAVGISLILLAMIGAAWAYSKFTQNIETIQPAGTEKIWAADGDSFNIGTRGFRLQGIDAPELNQICQDEAGRDWACGKAAHGALVLLLAQPGLSCQAEYSDQYKRALATCSSTGTADIAAAQVAAGSAISNEFNGIRDYGKEEDSARKAKIGIWRGEFIDPKQWRATHPRGH
jgi:endonuclease YncB( thermonuclease family)